MSIVQTPAKVLMTPRGIGTAGARLSDTDTGRAASMKRHPAGKKRESSVLQGLRHLSPNQVNESLDELQAWLDDYHEARAELEANRKAREIAKAERRKQHLALVADWK